MRRLPGSRGSIFVLPEELDAWAAGGTAGMHRERTQDWMRRRVMRVALWTAGIVLMAAAGLGGWQWMGRPHEIAAVRLEGGAVVATGAKGVDLWRVALQPPPAMDLRNACSSLMLADLDGDGRREVIGAACYGRPHAVEAAETARFEYFRILPSGNLLWQREIDPVLFGARGEKFAPGWGLQAMAMAPGAGRDRVWLALSHSIRYPGVVVELMPDGRVKEVFANYGHVNSLAAVRHGGRTWLLAGGASSALSGGFLALIDPDKGLSIAPEGGPPRYRFTTPAQARPEVYYHIPVMDLTKAYLDDVNPVYAIEFNGPSGGWARAQVGLEGCNVFFEFDLPLQPKAVRISSRCELGHRKFETRGIIGHPFERCPFLHEPLTLRKWTPEAGWTGIRVPTATMANTL